MVAGEAGRGKPGRQGFLERDIHVELNHTMAGLSLCSPQWLDQGSMALSLYLEDFVMILQCNQDVGVVL